MKEHKKKGIFSGFKHQKHEDSVRVQSSDTTRGQVHNKGIWKRFIHTCAVAKLPYFFLLIYIGLTIIQGIILVKIPQVNANFFSGDVSAQSVAMFIGMEMISTVITQAVLYVNQILRAKTNRNLRNVLWGKILRLKPRYYDRVSASTLLSRITVDTDSINTFVMDVLLEAGTQIYYLVLTINEMNRISIHAGFTLLAFLPLTLAVTFVTGRFNLKFQNKMQFKMSDMTNYLSELVSCLPLLKAFNRQGYERRRGRKVIDDYYKANSNVVWLDIARQVVGTIIGIGPEICIILIGVKMLGEGTVDAAGWYTFYLYAGSFIGFCATMGGIWESAKSVQGSLNKVSDVLYEKEESVEPFVTEIVDAGDLIFDHVTFAYEEEPVLKDASFTIPKKQNTAIIGFSGSGKSTILKLLERMYAPNEGRILMNGSEIKDCSIKEWRRNIAYVAQNTPLLSGSIRENMLYGISREVPDSEIMEAARLAHMDEFIAEKSEGLNYQVGQFGSKLSGGQRQKISVARAILTKAEFLIMDEPLASLDIISVNEIIGTIKALRGKRTVIFVTHESKAVKAADHIITVEKDYTVCEGSEQDMRLTNKFYNQLVKEEV